LPPSVQGNAEAEFDVVLLSDGNPLNVKLKRSSGNTAYDSAVERAIQKAKPLPLPPDQTLFRHFRELNLAFRPQQ
jgi:colicin import membrane protein